VTTFIEDVLPIALPIVGTLGLVLATTHAVLRVRDVRAAVGWVAIIVALPIVGALLYWLLGINRVRRRAVALLRDRERLPPGVDSEGDLPADASPSGLLQPVALPDLVRVVDRVTMRPLTLGNRVVPLVNGDEAYPAMLAAIDGATSSITLMTYIFDRDAVGLRFVDALARAHARGVEVRVMVDAVGARYSFPTIVRTLQKRRVPVARFNPTLFPPWRWTYANLRNHRKIMVVDGVLGFTGGINLRAGHVLAGPSRHPVLDLHFRIEGPVVEHMQRTFAEDWLFATRERLSEEGFFPIVAATPYGVSEGRVIARGITDGPDVDIDKLKWVLMGALSCATRRVRIATPYFLPEAELVAAMITAMLRGVELELVLSQKNNQVLVVWATDAVLPELVQHGAKVWKTTGPFDHSKVVVVDDSWVLLGSANLDPRSLRLNFEFNIECHDQALAQTMHAILDMKRMGGRLETLERLVGKDFKTRLRRVRSGVARLFLPYL
jgi:cardiolipin synthase